MARHEPPDGTGGGQEPELEAPIPGWRKPIALVGWGVLIAVLIALIIYGIIQLAHGSPPREPATTTTTTSPSSATTTTDTGTPTTTTADTGTPTTTSTPSPGAFPRLPSVITLPSLPGLPTAITLPPGL